MTDMIRFLQTTRLKVVDNKGSAVEESYTPDEWVQISSISGCDTSCFVTLVFPDGSKAADILRKSFEIA